MGKLFQKWINTPTRGELRAAQTDALRSANEVEMTEMRKPKKGQPFIHDEVPFAAPRGDIEASAVHAIDGTVTSGRSMPLIDTVTLAASYRQPTERQIEAAAEAIARAMPVGFVVTMEAAREFARAALEAARSVKP